MIVNLITGDIYVGSAITSKMPNRFHKHLFGLSGSKLVAAAVLKYGLKNFAFTVLAVAPNLVTKEDNKVLLNLEDYYLKTLTPVYNIATKASNTLGVKHTEENKLKMRLHYSSERREKIGALNRGKILSAVVIESLRKSALNRSPMTNETRAKISINSIAANLYTVARLDNTNHACTPSKGENMQIVRTIPNVAKLLGCSYKTVQRALKLDGVVKGE